MASKRSHEDIADLVADVGLPEGWVESLASHEEAAVLLAHVSQLANVSDRDLKRSRLELPSFARTKWREVAAAFHLPKAVKELTLDYFTPPTCWLPPSLHKECFRAGWRTMNVYQERTYRNGEAVRIKLLESWLAPIIMLFEGKAIDNPEAVVATTTFTDSTVEYEIVIIGGTLFLIAEQKYVLEYDDNKAELFLKLLSAAQVNRKNKPGGLRVYGLLTDLTDFCFYSYSPSTNSFAADQHIVVNFKRDDFCFDMIGGMSSLSLAPMYLHDCDAVTNKLFSVIMCGYLEMLRTMVSANQQKRDSVFSLLKPRPQTRC
ncbi:hypothetical protein B0H21DRAFT_154623 [Amylocystis lapponica]|nr:hypothetical protein B0H21DRAFT_154623 [Amylocystis lapponica]